MRRVTTAVFGLFLLSGFALSGWSNHQTGFDAVWNQGHALYRTLLKQHGIVGSSLVVLHDGVVVAEDYVGLANEEKGWPVDRDTIYHWASNTKTLTGIAIMQLRDRGLLSLDDPVTKYIPELRKVHNPFGSMDAITIRHLMTHSAGFRSATWPWGGEPWHPHEPLHWSQLEAMFPYTEILFEPGKEFRYSNPGVVFLGRIIELLTTDDYEVYIDKNIFSPLEMHRSYFDNTPYYLSRHKAQGYTRSTKAGLVATRPETNTGITVSNGGWNAPPGDLVKYVRFLLGDPAKKEYDVVLKRSSLEEMFQPKLSSMGLLFFVTQRGPRTLIGHTGGQNGFVTRFEIDPKARMAYVMAFNTITLAEKVNEASGTGKVMSGMRDFILDKLFPALEARTAAKRD